jgi:hypothetical protein
MLFGMLGYQRQEGRVGGGGSGERRKRKAFAIGPRPPKGVNNKRKQYNVLVIKGMNDHFTITVS